MMETSQIEQNMDAIQHPTKRSRCGRKARKKRKKLAAMQALVEAQANGEEIVSQDTSILPDDRNYVWPAVEKLSTLTEGDKKDLVAQLGYFPGNAIMVAARVNEIFPHGGFEDDTSPLVLQLYPLVLRKESDGTKSKRKRKLHQDENTHQDSQLGSNTALVEPFPTMYWVTHPCFKAIISQIELQNMGTEYEKRIRDDAQALESMKSAHLAYGKTRHAIITSEDLAYIQKRRWESAVDPSRGVAGIRNPAGVKCLHAHAAHFWSGCQENVVGKWVSEEVTRLLQVRSSSSDADK